MIRKMSNLSMEMLVADAKKNGASAGYGMGCFYFRFGRKSSPVGLYGTGLYLPENYITDGGLIRVNTAVVGTFSAQFIAANDLLAAQINPSAGAVIPIANRITTTAITGQKELMLNITTAITAGEFVGFLKMLPYNV
jgi:hypothetical protein